MRRGAAPVDSSRLVWVATAHQRGPVSYRDPAGAISPDGRLIAYSEGRFLRVRPVGGGPAMELPPADAQIRHLAWRPDSRAVLTDGNPARAGGVWAIYDIAERTRRPVDIGEMRQPAWSPDGRRIAGVVNGSEGQELRIVSFDGRAPESHHVSAAIAYPAWTPSGDVACVATTDGRSRVTIPCGEHPLRLDPDVDAYGPIAFSPNGDFVYAGLPNRGGTLDLWSASTRTGRARQLTSFSRDSYAPSVAADGAVLFKLQSYRTVVSVVPADGGAVSPLATFQSETPSWDPSGRFIGITFGTWRRVVDDAHYPDIAQDTGIIAADPTQPADRTSSVVHASASEDQALCWSPSGRWIAFHSHKDQSDDLWLRPAEGRDAPVRITFLGRGAETGWPRWSPDGRAVLFSGFSRETHRTAIYVVGVDQESGRVTSEAREVAIGGVGGDVTHAEWLPGNTQLVAVGKEGPGRQVILTAPIDGGDARIVRRFASEHDMPGLAVSPDGRAVAFIAPAADGYFQLFRMPIDGGEPQQITTDPSNKTQPAWSPDGKRIALTVWNYDAHFFLIR